MYPDPALLERQSSMTTATQMKPQVAAEQGVQLAYLIMDTESVPDGKLVAAVKYPKDHLTPEEAVRRAQETAREQSFNGSDFLPVTFQFPVAVCMLRVGADFTLQKISRLGEPDYKPRQIVDQFWNGFVQLRNKYKDKVKLVTFNGRGFDMPLLELAAFRYGCKGGEHFQNRNRYGCTHLDLMDWLSNFGALRMAGGLDVLVKLLGKPGKMSVTGQEVYQLHLEGKAQEINDYCMFDTLDTYFVFLRTRVMLGELTLEKEHQLECAAKEFVQNHRDQYPALNQYLENWGEWNPWP
jgi:3'-5' exonuclease